MILDSAGHAAVLIIPTVYQYQYLPTTIVSCWFGSFPSYWQKPQICSLLLLHLLNPLFGFVSIIFNFLYNKYHHGLRLFQTLSKTAQYLILKYKRQTQTLYHYHNSIYHYYTNTRQKQGMVLFTFILLYASYMSSNGKICLFLYCSTIVTI